MRKCVTAFTECVVMECYCQLLQLWCAVCCCCCCSASACRRPPGTKVPVASNPVSAKCAILQSDVRTHSSMSQATSSTTPPAAVSKEQNAADKKSAKKTNKKVRLSSIKREPDTQTQTQRDKEKRQRPFAHADLECIVCKEFPSGKIFQCQNGHMLCTACYDRVVESANPSCPSCRQHLPSERRSRNRFAEQVLATVMVSCSNAGCTERLPFGKIKAHESESCLHRIVLCKFEPVGCDWKGVKASLKEHQKTCAIKDKSAKSILKRVLDRENRLKVTERQARAMVASQTKIAELLSSRCRDIAIRDVVVERDEICDDIASHVFRALGCSFSLVLRRKKIPRASGEGEDVKVGLSLRLQFSKPRRLRLSVFLMKGPDSDLGFPPMIQTVKFTKKERISELFELPLTEEQMKEMFEMGSLNVRVGLIDRRRGHARSFTSSNPGTIESGASEDSDSDGDVDDEDDDEDDEGAEGVSEWVVANSDLDSEDYDDVTGDFSMFLDRHDHNHDHDHAGGDDWDDSEEED